MKCETCGKGHPTALHDDKFPVAAQSQATSETRRCLNQRGDAETQRRSSQPEGATDQLQATSLRVMSGVGDKTKRPGCVHSMILPVFVRHREHPDVKVLTYAVLDPQSDACFVTGGTCEALQIQGQSVSLELKTVTGQSVVSSSVIDDLVIEPVQGGDSIVLPQCYSREVIPAERSCIPRRESVRMWRHLAPIADEIPLYYPAAEIGLLVGMNCPKAVKPRDVITGDDNDPWAVRTILG